MLSIISASTKSKSDPSYLVDKSMPDACIFNKDTAILIESKTQSPLVYEQIEAHINHFFGSVTKKPILVTWEEISEKLNLIKKSLPQFDKFLVSQFCDFLDLIGIAEFNGFSSNDFSLLGSLVRTSKEDFLDFKRVFHKKVLKLVSLLHKEWS